MDLIEFIDEVFLRFPPKTNDFKPIEHWYREYRIALKSNNECDYESAYNDFLKNYRYATTPTPRVLKDFLDNHIINRQDSALEYMRRIKETPKLDLETLDENVKCKVLEFCQKYGAKTRLKK